MNKFHYVSIFLLSAVIMTVSTQTARGTSIADLNNNMTSPTPIPNATTPTPTPTPIPLNQSHLTAPIDLSSEDTIGDVIGSTSEPTIQELISSDPNTNSIVVNFSSTSDISAETNEDGELTIVISPGEPNGLVAEEQPEEEIEEDSSSGDSSSGDSSDNGSGDSGSGNDNVGGDGTTDDGNNGNIINDTSDGQTFFD